MGKTFIAILLIKFFLGRGEEREEGEREERERGGSLSSSSLSSASSSSSSSSSSFSSSSSSLSSSSSSNEKKWIIFLTSSVPLVLQQAEVIRANIGIYEGETEGEGEGEGGADVLALYSCFDATNEWKQKLKKCSVLVMTHGVLDQVLLYY